MARVGVGAHLPHLFPSVSPTRHSATPLLGARSASTYVPCQVVLALSPLTNQHNDAAKRASFPELWPSEKARQETSH